MDTLHRSPGGVTPGVLTLLVCKSANMYKSLSVSVVCSTPALFACIYIPHATQVSLP